MRVTDRILGAPRSTLAQAQTYAARFRFPNGDADVLSYLTEVYRLAPLVGLDPSIVVAQSAHETGDWSSRWWNERRNPAGIGITGDPAQNEASKTFASGAEAAQAQIVHLWLYTSFGDATPIPLRDLFKIDPRATALIESGRAGTVKTIQDLTGKWAVDPRYAEKIVAKGNAIFAALPDQTGAPMPETRIPVVVLDAGHRSTDRTGNPAEMDLTDDLARAYRAELRRRGFTAFWYQADLDRDTDPDETVGTLDTVAKGLGRWLASQPWALMLSLHYDGARSVLHAIVPDNVGLTTAYPEGRVAGDTAANNVLDRRLGVAIVGRMVAAGLGAPFRGLLGETGLMSERETGVGRDGFRLAVFAATAPSQQTAARLVIEHGGTADPAARRFAGFARAAADAIESVYGTPTPTPTTTTTAPPTPSPPELPAGMSAGVADRLLNPLGLTKPDGGAIGFAATGELGSWWLRRALATVPAGGRWTDGRWPGLIAVFARGDGRTVHQFGDGAVYEQEAP